MKQMVYLDQIAYLFVYLNIVQPLICKTVARLLGEFEMKKSAENHNIYLKLKIMQIVIEIINNNTILKTWNRNFSRLKDVHYNHCASPSARSIYFPLIPSGTGRSPRVVHIKVS